MVYLHDMKNSYQKNENTCILAFFLSVVAK